MNFDFSGSESVLFHIRVVVFLLRAVVHSRLELLLPLCCAAVGLGTEAVRDSSAEQLFKVAGRKLPESYKLLRADFITPNALSLKTSTVIDEALLSSSEVFQFLLL